MDVVIDKKKIKVKLNENGKLIFKDTVRHRFYGCDNKEWGYIEVSVSERENRHFAERLEKFLDEATLLYDRIVLGNTTNLNEWEKVN